MSSFLAALINLLFALHALFVPSTLTFDAAKPVGEVTGGASGFLYGVAEEGVPSQEITRQRRPADCSTRSATCATLRRSSPQTTACSTS